MVGDVDFHLFMDGGLVCGVAAASVAVISRTPWDPMPSTPILVSGPKLAGQPSGFSWLAPGERSGAGQPPGCAIRTRVDGVHVLDGCVLGVG